MTQTREFTVGDQLTSLLAKLYKPSGEPIVLGAGETVTFRMVSTAGVVKIAGDPATIVSRGSLSTGTPAEVRYDWAAGDVDTAGFYAAWFIRTSAGETEHFPTQDIPSPEFEIVFKAAS
jgi:hypothetical protein